MRLNDVQAHPLGMIAVNEEGTHYINQNIIPPNQSIPVKCARKVLNIIHQLKKIMR